MKETLKERRLIEAGFPCHQVGAETQRERDTGKAPPTHRLHVWWARRPLTPSRAAVLASILPADTDPEWFLKELGIEVAQVDINGVPFVLDEKLQERIVFTGGTEKIEVDDVFLRALRNETETRANQRVSMRKMLDEDQSLLELEVFKKWDRSTQEFQQPLPEKGCFLPVKRTAADPAWFKELLQVASSKNVRVPNLYGYTRAYQHCPQFLPVVYNVMDLTAGGGSIPFEALRLGAQTIANELNPVASVILHATLEYPARYGIVLLPEIEHWGNRLLQNVESKMDQVFPRKFRINDDQLRCLEKNLKDVDSSRFEEFSYEDTMTYLYTRQVTCPHCGGEAPLLNTCWLSKSDGDQWGVAVVTDGKPQNGTVRFRTYRVSKGRGPGGENPDMSTVTKGKGVCVHCGQGIDAEEIKRQARGESPFGKWKDRLYAVAAVRYQPKLDKNGRIQRYKTGDKAGQIKTEKVRYFRPPNERDLEALTEAEKMLEANWTRWEDAGLIPTERIPEGNDMRPVIYGMSRWCDMFTPRQLLGHLFLVEELNRLKPRILEEIGPEKGKAVITYLQFAIDKGLDYNSRQTRWHYSRGVLLGTFARHDFSLKWTFGEMVFTGPNSGAAWGLSQILDAYKGIADLLEPVQKATNGDPPLTLLNGTAAAMPQVPGQSVDVICFDPPYYNNVQYGELSDYFYVWQKRTLGDLYPDLFHRRLTNKEDEVVANPARDKGEANAKAAYERMMGEIFEEARRILKDDGIMTMMFTHKSQEAWETLTQALIEKGWVITSSVPVESETEQGIHTKETASAISSIFISCRKRTQDDGTPSSWKGFGGTGVQQKVQAGVEQGLEEFSHLRLNPVDRMVACYGRALQVLSENWPVLDGDEQVGPKRAMLEASRVVAEAQFRETARGHLSLSDLAPEAAMAMLLFGVFGLAPFDYDDGLNLSKSLNIALETKTGGYLSNGRFIGINTEESSRRSSGLRAEEKGFSAPLARRGSKLRLVLPEERDERRLENPQTEWDLLQGTIMAYREGMEVAARGYLDRKARDKTPVVTNLLRIWAEEIADDTLKKEAQGLLFGLGARQEV